MSLCVSVLVSLCHKSSHCVVDWMKILCLSGIGRCILLLSALGLWVACSQWNVRCMLKTVTLNVLIGVARIFSVVGGALSSWPKIWWPFFSHIHRHILPPTTFLSHLRGCTSPNSAPFLPHSNKKCPEKNFFVALGGAPARLAPPATPMNMLRLTSVFLLLYSFFLSSVGLLGGLHKIIATSRAISVQKIFLVVVLTLFLEKFLFWFLYSFIFSNNDNSSSFYLAFRCKF